jgi:diguanylate cyclase
MTDSLNTPAPLDEDADTMRAELRRLRRDLAQVQQEFNDTRAVQLLEANEQLVLTALQAETIAESAMVKLNELTRVTERDALTDMPNRTLMLDRLQTAIAMAKRRDTHIAVLFVDIDHFKRINDTHGHLIGDQVLQIVARRLEGAVRDSDTVSRHSGDEFVVLLAEVSQASDAALIASKMLTAIAGHSGTPALPFKLSVSVGIAVYPQDGEDPATLIDRADKAMYRSKRLARGGYQFYNAEFSSVDGSTEPQQPLDSRPARLSQPVSVRGDLEPQTQGPNQRQARDLRDANEQLVLSSLAAHETQAQAMQAHLRQVKFLAMVAHELRNPLAPLRTAAEMLNRVRTDEQQHAKLQETIQKQVAHMARIIDDLLDGSRVGSGKFHLEFATIDLVDVLNMAVDSCGHAMTLKLLQMSTRLPAGPLAVLGDAVRLAQVFRNLLDNATKYTPKGGGISLDASVLGREVVVTVSDNGIGIAADVLPDVFNLFVQGPRAVSVHTGGLGIGLAVVRELVEAHGGTVVACSAGHDQGSEFVVRLPLVAGAPLHAVAKGT